MARTAEVPFGLGPRGDAIATGGRRGPGEVGAGKVLQAFLFLGKPPKPARSTSTQDEHNVKHTHAQSKNAGAVCLLLLFSGKKKTRRIGIGANLQGGNLALALIP